VSGTLKTRIPDDSRLAIVAAVRGGERRAAVARRFGISDTAVTKFCRAAGLLDPPISQARRAAIRAATELNSELGKYRRSRQSLALLHDGDRLRRQLWAPTIVFAFGRNAEGEHAFVQHEISQPDAKAQQATAIAMGICLQRALELARFDLAEGGVSQVRASIVDLMERLAAPQPGDEEAQGAG
jgi:transposase-like protein